MTFINTKTKNYRYFVSGSLLLLLGGLILGELDKDNLPYYQYAYYPAFAAIVFGIIYTYKANEPFPEIPNAELHLKILALENEIKILQEKLAKT